MKCYSRVFCAMVLGLSLAHCSSDGQDSSGDNGGAGGENNGGNGFAGSGNPEPGDIPAGPEIVDDGTITAKVTASRVTGVAPLGVLFDASETTGAARPFHELQYVWNFGDSGAGTWALTGHGKNSATGGVAAHVFEKPGTYKVQLTVRNAELKGATSEVTITVTDPETVFASSTYCFANGSDFAGCPASAKRVTTQNTDAIKNAIAKGRRLLLRRGDSFEFTSELDLGPGSITLGAFGNCEGADSRRLCRNAPEIKSTNTSDYSLVTVGNDGRVMDLKITGPTGDSESAALGLGGIAPFVYRVQARGFQTGIRAAFYETIPDQLAIAESDIGEANSNQIFIGSERLIVLGNHFHDSFTSHVLRVWSAYKGSIAENLIENASIGGANGRHALKLHGFAEGDGGEGEGLLDGKSPNGGGPLHRTSFVNIADNTFGASPPWPVSIGPQFDGVDERVLDVVFERNFFRTSGKVFPDAQPLDTPIHCTAYSDITVRNNIFDATGAGEDYTAFDISTNDGAPQTPTNMQFLNNLVYRADRVGSRLVMVRIAPSAKNTTVRNNLGVAPSYAAGGRVVADDDGSNTSMDTNMFIDNPGFSQNQPANPFDFRPAAGAATIDKGAAAPVIDDYSRRVRQAPIDLGPFEFGGF